MCAAQTPASARQLIAIKVTGSKRYPEEAIAAATGLQMGTAVNDDDFKKAARRLGDTGVFTDIAYTFSYSSAGTKLELHVTDAAKFVPARFEDFVWFSDAELFQRIKQHAPLFDGQLPLAPSAVNPGLQSFTHQGFKDTVTPRAMTLADIEATIIDYAAAARNASRGL